MFLVAAALLATIGLANGYSIIYGISQASRNRVYSCTLFSVKGGMYTNISTVSPCPNDLAPQQQELVDDTWLFFNMCEQDGRCLRAVNVHTGEENTLTKWPTFARKIVRMEFVPPASLHVLTEGWELHRVDVTTGASVLLNKLNLGYNQLAFVQSFEPVSSPRYHRAWSIVMGSGNSWVNLTTWDVNAPGGAFLKTVVVMRNPVPGYNSLIDLIYCGAADSDDSCGAELAGQLLAHVVWYEDIRQSVKYTRIYRIDPDTAQATELASLDIGNDLQRVPMTFGYRPRFSTTPNYCYTTRCWNCYANSSPKVPIALVDLSTTPPTQKVYDLLALQPKQDEVVVNLVC